MPALRDDAVFEHIADGVVVHDPQTGAVVDANRQFCALLGFTREELLDLEVAALAAGETGTVDSYRDRLRRAVDDGPERFDWWFRRADGTRVPCEVHLSAADLDDGVYVLASVRDNTAATRHERQLEQYRRRLDGAMFAGDLAWWEMDVGSGEVVFHENKADMLGYSPGDFTHYEDFTDLLHPADYERGMDAMRAHLEGEAERYDVEYRIEDADGEYRWFHDIGGVTTWDSEGTPEKVTGIVVDITRRKAAEIRLREQNERLALLNRIVRHDIRNDMTVIKGWLELLREDLPPESREYVDRALRASEHVIELTHATRDLLEVLVESDGDIEVAATPVRPVVENELERVREAFGHASLELAGPVPDVAVAANEMLSSVVRNLMNNAVQHNDRDAPVVEVAVEERADTVVIDVADDGPGVPDDRKEAVFARGEQGLDSGGTGVGLYLVATLVEGFGGSVWVEDNEPRGAVFRVELPKLS